VSPWVYHTHKHSFLICLAQTGWLETNFKTFQPDSEECNEMVFCDKCNICVHQACYGITNIPSGSWLCRTCTLGIKPKCELCPNRGGAMKATKSGQKWAHVSCALWIPEVSIGCVEKMEPITKISKIPQSRWNLVSMLEKLFFFAADGGPE